MSCTETHIGKVRKIDLQGKSIEDWAQNIAEELGYELGDFYDSYKELVFDELYFRYVFVGDEVYEIIEDKEISEEDIEILTPEGNNTYSFTMQFYNGGTCLNEMLENAIKRAKNG